MASDKKKYPDFFKKDLPTCNNSFVDSEPDITQMEDSDEKILEISIEDETSSENKIEDEFKNEDSLISKLYRKVVDDVMERNKLRESTVDAAIHDMKAEILQGHKKGFRRFPGIDFCKPENCCGYLRRYAICHTGLVKKLVWNFFSSKEESIRIAREEIASNAHLKVVSLGGGPGNDVVGFCSALQALSSNSIQQLELIIVDINEGWKPFFPIILRKARDKDYGSFSQCLGKQIRTGFMQADLTKDEVFDDETLSSVLGQADVLLMVKLTSFLHGEETSNLLHNVINSMKPEAKLIFIDHPYDEQFFLETESLDIIYHDHLKYKLGFKTKKSRSPSIDSTYAHVAVLQKIFIQNRDSSDSEEG